MKRRLVFPVALALLVALPVLAQRGGERGSNPPRANQGRVPPPPPRSDNPRSEPEPERHDAGHVNSMPHVNKDHWYGHDRRHGALVRARSEEHTSELQSHLNLVCRLLLEK